MRTLCLCGEYIGGKIMATRRKEYTVKSTVNQLNIPQKPKRFKKIAWIIGSILIFIIVIRIVVIIGARGKKKSSELDRIPVRALKIKRDMIRDVVYLTERLQALSDVNVYPAVPGNINAIRVDIGSRVNQNQVVATIDRNIVGSEYENAIVKAPISGEVGRIFVDKGAYVSPNTAIMNIINYGTIKIYVNIPERYMNRISRGDVALINVEDQNNEEYIGKIDQLSSSIDPLTGTFQAKILVPNNLRKIKPGSFAKIRIVLSTKKAIIIRKEGIIENEEAVPFVYKISNNMARKVYIKEGINEEAKIEILEGLSENDLVITTGKENVKDNQLVYIENAKDLGLVTDTNHMNVKKESKP